MNKTFFSNLMIMTIALPLLFACGGGGGAGVAPQPTTAVITLSTSVIGTIPPTTSINSYDVTVTLPQGVTVKASPDAVNTAVLVTDPGVVAAVGSASGSSILAVYTAASGTAPAVVKVHLASVNGFGAGEFSTITCDIASGGSLNFGQPTLDDATGLDASASTVTLTGELGLASRVSIN